ncbi:MAG: xylulokinase [Planctomycetes bacterium]|nr:xylulokinase [Planctomycetota bacterium]
MKYHLGIDIGTTGVKTLLLNRRGSVVGASIKEYPMAMPEPGWAEQSPEDWWQAVIDSVREVLNLSGIPAGDIAGIGLSGQMHGSVFLDKDNKVLRPCILWCDQRTAKECAYIEWKIGRKKLIRLAGNPALTGFTAGKVLWVRNNEPGVYKKINKILLPKDYIRFRLTGAFATEVSDASGTLFLDVKNRKWSKQILEELDVPLSFMPECRESWEISGMITEKAGRLTGLKTGTPVIGGGGDQAAQAIGTGIVKPGIISINIGTSGVVFACSEKPQFDPAGRVHTFCHAVPRKWHVMGVMLAAGGSLRWFRDNLGREEARAAKQKGIDPYEALIEEARNIPAGSEGLMFLPYLSGERTPYADPCARGVFFGLGLRHTKGHMIKAVLEGVCFGLRDSLGIIEELGIPVKEIRVTGGGARSKAWIQILSDVLGREIITVEPAEGSAYGAALLAGIGAGVYADAAQACGRTIRTKAVFRPSPANASVYNRRYRLFRSLYKSLKEDFKINQDSKISRR